MTPEQTFIEYFSGLKFIEHVFSCYYCKFGIVGLVLCGLLIVVIISRKPHKELLDAGIPPLKINEITAEILGVTLVSVRKNLKFHKFITPEPEKIEPSKEPQSFKIIDGITKKELVIVRLPKNGEPSITKCPDSPYDVEVRVGGVLIGDK